jgi:predicted peptidase
VTRSGRCAAWLACLAFFWSGLAAQQSEQRFETRVTREIVLDYLLHLPPGYTDDGDPWPLVLFLHGAGERGSDLERVKLHGPPKLIAAGRQIPAIVVSPQCPTDSWWTSHEDDLLLLLDDLVARLNVDESRVYLTGLSMGGYGTWALAAAEPQRFAAAVPVCGGGQRILARRLRELPIWAFHGDADPVVPMRESVDMVEAIRGAGGSEARLTVYPDLGHDAWTATYDDPAMWEWLFAQRRPAETEGTPSGRQE